MNREAARVIIFNEHDRVLLFRGVDSTLPQRDSWWFTPGGGLEPGETSREAALREVKEETGLTLDTVSGPVYEQKMDFSFEGVDMHQYEQFFVAHVNDFAITSDGWTDLEKRTMLESRWWSLDELEATDDVVYPEALARLVRAQLQGRKLNSQRRGHTMDTARGPVTELDVDECWGLLAANTFGRIATCAAGEIDIFPINYYADGSTILIRTAPGTKLLELTLDHHVAFEIDGLEDDKAWSVVVKGTAQQLELNHEIELAETAPLEPWIPTLKYRFVRITPTAITGRAFTPGPEPDRY